MIFKTRTIPHALLVYEAVAKRQHLSDFDKLQLYTLRKGYDGELIFDAVTEKLKDHLLVLNDLLLFKEKYFQLDTLILVGGKLYLYEVKNYEGACYYKDGLIYNLRHKEVLNPALQVETKATYLRRLLHSRGFSLPIEAFTVFVSPNFFLYETPLKAPILVPGLLDSHFKQLTKNAQPIPPEHYKLAALLRGLHIDPFPHETLPSYQIATLRKGMICANCGSFSLEVKDHYCYCSECQGKERVSQAIVRSTEEFKLLFPKEKVTVNAISEWCAVIPSRHRIQRTLAMGYKQLGKTHGSYYE